MAKSQKTIAHERQVLGYLPPKYFNVFEAYRACNGMGKSETLNLIVRDFFDRMPADEKERVKEIASRQSKNSY